MKRWLKIEGVCFRAISDCSECPLVNYDEDYGYNCGLIVGKNFVSIEKMFINCPIPNLKEMKNIRDTKNEKNSMKTCEWEKIEDDFRCSYYTSECGEDHDNIEIENFKYCPYCGGKIKIKEETENYREEI